MSKKIRKAILVFLAAVLCCFTAASAGTVTLPAAVTAIPAEAFYGDTSLEKVVIPAKVTSIGSKAFANSSVEVVEFLGSGSVKIAGDAFDGSGLAAVFAPEGSPAYKWAVAQGYSVNPKTVYRALVIGEKNFSGGEVTMRNVGDANHIAAMLGRVYGPEGTRYKVTKKINVGCYALEGLLQSTFKDTADTDVSLFFIATHGNSSGDGDLIMPEYDSGNGVWYNYGMSFSSLAQLLNTYVRGKVIVILESCGAGSAIYQEGVAENSLKGIEANAAEEESFDPSAFVQEAIAAFSAADPGIAVQPLPEDNELFVSQAKTGELRTSKFYVLAAARHHELSWGVEYKDDTDGTTSYNVFTDWLIDGVGSSSNSPADNNPKDGTVTLRELFSYIKSVGDEDIMGYDSAGNPLYQHVQVYPKNSTYPLFLHK